MDEEKKPETLGIKKGASSEYNYYYNRDERLNMPGSPRLLHFNKKQKKTGWNIVLVILVAVIISLVVIVFLSRHF